MNLSQVKEEKNDDSNKKAYSYDEAMELTGHGCYNYLLLLACSIISNAIALDMFGFGIVVAAAKCDLKLGLTETGLLASAPFSGVLFAFPWGYFADTQGRRTALLLSTFTSFIFAGLSSLSTSWQLMLAFKIIASSFSCASFTLTITILGECTSSSYRNCFLFIMNSANLVAECVSFGLAYLVLPLQFSIPIPLLGINFNSWRLYTLVLALPLGIGGLIMACLQESPKFLANRGYDEKALEILRSIYQRNGGKKDEYPVHKIISTDDGLTNQKISFWESVVKQTVPIFKPPFIWRTLQIFYLLSICSSTNNAFIMWYPTIVNHFFNSVSVGGWNSDDPFCERIFSNNSVVITNSEYGNLKEECDATILPLTTISGVLYGLIFCAMTLAVAVVARHRKLVLISCLLLSGVSCILVNLKQPVASLIFFVVLQISAVGMPSVASYCVDLYPTSYRGMVTSLAMMVARLSSLAGVNVVGAAITDYCSLTFYCWSIFVFSGVILSLFLPSDKKYYK